MSVNSLMDVVNSFHQKALTEDQREFYQPTAIARDGETIEYHENLFEYINKSVNNAHILVFGHGGCGKSTEMRMLAGKLRTIGTPSVMVDALNDLSINDFTYIDILVLIVKHLTDYIDCSNVKIDKRIISAFKTSLSTTITSKYWEREATASIESDAEVSVAVPFLVKFITKIAASLKMGSGMKEELRQEIKPQIADVAATLNALIENINDINNENNGTGKIVIMIDGLEKCRQECVTKLFTDDVSALKAINTHLVVACPISLYRSPDAAVLMNNFDRADVMPMIKTHNHDLAYSSNRTGIKVIKHLVLKRVSESFFNKGVLELLIKMSGGNLRDVCYLLKNSAFTAHMRKKTTIDRSSLMFNADKYATDLFLRIESKYYPTIMEIYKGNHNIRNDKSIPDLLYAGIVFEYNGERWIDLHPLIRSYIDKQPEAMA